MWKQQNEKINEMKFGCSWAAKHHKHIILYVLYSLSRQMNYIVVGNEQLSLLWKCSLISYVMMKQPLELLQQRQGSVRIFGQSGITQGAFYGDAITLSSGTRMK